MLRLILLWQVVGLGAMLWAALASMLAELLLERFPALVDSKVTHTIKTLAIGCSVGVHSNG
jgi:hypothetical protein